MNNQANIAELEKAMEENRTEMRKINKLFSTVYYICVIPSMLVVMMGLAYGVAILLTLGYAEYDITVFMVAEWAASVAGVVLFGLSDAKNRECTVWSAVILLFLALISVTDALSVLMYLAQAVLQGICFTKYSRIEYLKCQLGYPDFDPSVYVSFVADSNRRLTDREIKAQLSENRENRQDIHINEISSEMPELKAPDESEYLTAKEIADRKFEDIFKE